MTDSVPDLRDSRTLSDELVVIEPNRGWFDFGLRDLWSYRELLYFLVWKDIKVRYKQTALGAAWAVLQPLLTVVVFTVFFNRLAGIGSDGIPYPVFSLAALLPWTFFSQGLATSSNSLVGSSNLITKVYFPRILLPAGAVFAGFVDLAISFLVLAGLLIYYGIRPTTALFLIPVTMILVFMATLGAGTFLSVLNVRFRDVRYLVPFSVQLLLFVSPVIYPASDVISWLEANSLPGWIYGINPMVGVIEGTRWAVSGLGHPPIALLVTSMVVSSLGMVMALFFFRRMERKFADIV